MKIALVTTTINVPKVLAAYRRLIPDNIIDGGEIRFFVVGDQKTPPETQSFCVDLGGCTYLSPVMQRSLGYKHSELIGWNTDSRRNIAVLEALKWGADILVSIDDDMIPLGYDFFTNIALTLSRPFSGVCFNTAGAWFDAGRCTMPAARQRGLPFDSTPMIDHAFVSDIQVGAMQGIILGTPDTDAATTIVNRPLVHSASDILKSGFVVDPSTKAVFNSQITAFRRELAPAFAQFYKWQGRNTDILASVLMRRVMRDRGLYTYFGPPMAYHARAPREPQKDMNAEQWGLNHIRPLQDYLENTDLLKGDDLCVTDHLRRFYEGAMYHAWWDEKLSECALAWLEDCEKVL